MRAALLKLPPVFTVVMVGLGTALSLTGDTTLYIALPTHTAEAGIALSQVGLMLSVNRLIRLFINGPYGFWIERVPRRRMLVPSLFVGGLSYLLYTVPGFWPLLIGRLTWGAAWAGIWIAGSVTILDVATDRNRGRYSGIYQMFYFLGMGGSAILGGVLTDTLGYIPGLRVSAAVALAMAFGWLLFLPEPLDVQRRYRPAAPAPPHPDHPHRADAVELGLSREARRALIASIVVMGVNWLIFLGVIGATISLLLEEHIGREMTVLGVLLPLATLTGALSAVNQLLSLISSPLAGWTSDRTGNRWGLVVLASLVGLVSLVLVAVGGAAVVILALMLSAVATAVMQTQIMTLLGDYARANRQGRLFGALNTVGDLGSALGPLLAYALLPSIGLDGVYWLMAGVLLLIVPLTIWQAWRELRTPHTPARAA